MAWLCHLHFQTVSVTQGHHIKLSKVSPRYVSNLPSAFFCNKWDFVASTPAPLSLTRIPDLLSWQNEPTNSIIWWKIYCRTRTISQVLQSSERALFFQPGTLKLNIESAYPWENTWCMQLLLSTQNGSKAAGRGWLLANGRLLAYTCIAGSHVNDL
jgi:hypothetical protein